MEINERDLIHVRVPRKFQRGSLTQYLSWRAYRLRTKVMDNGYIVTLAAIRTDSAVVLGASACAPDEFEDDGSSYPRALGRAVQQAFNVEFEQSLLVTLLIPRVQDVIQVGLSAGNIIDGPVAGPSGILRVSASEEISIRRFAAEYYTYVAYNAEFAALSQELDEIERRHGNRFSILVDNTVWDRL